MREVSKPVFGPAIGPLPHGARRRKIKKNPSRRGDRIRTNYHTHTSRCLHAEGTDEAYVRSAIAGGFSVLGFSDHSPWPYQDGYESGIRMPLSQLPDYVRSVRALSGQYAGKLDVRLGLEAEYYPEYAGWLKDACWEHGVSFLLFGNHFDNPGEEGYFGYASAVSDLRRYVARAEMGLASGLFDCLAHPDLFMQGYARFDDDCRAAAKDVCAAARACGVPLEFNLSGFYNTWRRGAGYPAPAFWQIAAREGVSAVVGLDAHKPERLTECEIFDLAVQHLDALGIPRVELLPAQAPRPAFAASSPRGRQTGENRDSKEASA